MKVDKTFHPENFVLFSLFSAVAVFLLLRSAGLLPSVFADEYLYSKFARQLPLSLSTIPDYLYLYIYKYTNSCGSGFLECSRVLNVLFFMSAAPFIYKSARRFVAPRTSALIALLAVMAPINTYTAYFMPESLYFLGFWVLSWFILRLDNESKWIHWMEAGCLFGLSSLIKPHTLFFGPAIAIYCIYLSRSAEKKWIRSASVNLIALLLTGLATKLLFGFILAGPSGVTLFGSTYSSVATSTASSSISIYFKILKLVGTNIIGHLLGISLLFGMSICIAIFHLIRLTTLRANVHADERISIYAGLIITNLIIVVGLFSASIAVAHPDQPIVRIHMRYYDFAFPLLMIVAATQLSNKRCEISRRWKLFLAIPIIAIILYAAIAKMFPYTPDLVDGPELRGFTVNPVVMWILTVLSLTALVQWIISARVGARTFVYVFLPLTIIFSSYYANHELRRRMVPDVFDRAGIFTKAYLPDVDLSKLTVVGSDPASLFRTLFYLDNKDASFEVIPKDSTYDAARSSIGKDWALIIGDHPLLQEAPFQIGINHFTLARIAGNYAIDFEQSAWPGIVSGSNGLSAAEPGGTWSSGNEVTLIFARSLPKKFSITLFAYAFGPNIGRQFTMRVGNSSKEFTLGATETSVHINFLNPSQSDTLRIYVPFPTSPRELGIGDDPRHLGIGLKRLVINPK